MSDANIQIEMSPDIATEILHRAVRAGASAQQQIDMDLNLPFVKVDEVAIYFKNGCVADAFIQMIQPSGWTLFNECFSQVFDENWDGKASSLLGSSALDNYEVVYYFLKHNGLPGIRLEVMCVLDGQASLHRELPNGTIVHTSWKCGSLPHYARTRDQMHAIGLETHAAYRSDYGMFSYWGPPGKAESLPASLPYLKPRVNCRDFPS